MTRRELEMLRLAANGNTNVTIARWLDITPTTVNHGLRRAYAKLGAQDRTHAVAVALVRGLLKPHEIAGVQMLPAGTSVHRHSA
ncbi:helix-turn-helix transcriptional regulator [Streptomyces sp. Ac-502]|uniref:helix-turn-helix domain-containing protein n=1 Tax=Streptomyces sp. Ac-502 TaxID=3342801 RepID=UPI0038622640